MDFKSYIKNKYVNNSLKETIDLDNV